MFNNKNLQIASYGHLDFYYFQSFLSQFKNASLVNYSGELLFSKDDSFSLTTTSRLVTFQIVQKYLKLNPGDVFMTNDPDNGGFDYKNIIFVSCLTQNLFLIWVEQLKFVNFKIPLSPLFENGQVNALIWNALVEPHPLKKELGPFFEKQIKIFKSCLNATPFLNFLSEPDLQQLWFSTCQAEFERKFDLKPHGQYALATKYHQQQIKLQATLEEKQKVRLITLDFSSTELAQDFSAASHIVESALIFELVQYFKISGFLSQPILNSIKLIMPPRSIVSKANTQGLYNFEMQGFIRQVLKHILVQISPTKKNTKNSAFQIHNLAEMILSQNDQVFLSYFLDSMVQFEDCPQLIKHHQAWSKDNQVHFQFENKTNQDIEIKLSMISQLESNLQRTIKVNNESLSKSFSQIKLKPKDQVMISWCTR